MHKESVQTKSHSSCKIMAENNLGVQLHQITSNDDIISEFDPFFCYLCHRPHDTRDCGHLSAFDAWLQNIKDEDVEHMEQPIEAEREIHQNITRFMKQDQPNVEQLEKIKNMEQDSAIHEEIKARPVIEPSSYFNATLDEVHEANEQVEKHNQSIKREREVNIQQQLLTDDENNDSQPVVTLRIDH